MTGIVIGGALGSLASWAFRDKENRQKIAEKAHEYYEKGVEGMSHLAEKYEQEQQKENWFSKIFRRK